MNGVASELIQQYMELIEAPDGRVYTVQAHGERRDDGTWEGWIEFHPVGGSGPALRTGRETSQPDRGALAYWASGLEPLYFDGAFNRAS